MQPNRPKNDLFLRALARESTERVPLWVMRQAGRYLPEYRKLRARAGSFIKLYRTPELACEATLQPIRHFDLDAAIIFSDILVIPDALGLGLGFAEGEGPFLERPVRDESAIAKLGALDLEKITFVVETIRRSKQELAGRIPLIGFAGGPFTLACYMIEGHGGEFLQARRFLYARPDLFQRLLTVNTAAVTASLISQASAGVDVLMVFESWAGLVPLPQSKALLLEPLRAIVTGVRAAGYRQPIIAFLRNAGDITEQAVATGVDALGVDWRCDLTDLSRRYGAKVALQGNLDPAVLLTDKPTIEKEVRRVLASHVAAAGHIFNLGHGIHKDTPPENMEVLVAAVQQESTILGS